MREPRPQIGGADGGHRFRDGVVEELAGVGRLSANEDYTLSRQSTSSCRVSGASRSRFAFTSKGQLNQEWALWLRPERPFLLQSDACRKLEGVANAVLILESKNPTAITTRQPITLYQRNAILVKK